MTLIFVLTILENVVIMALNVPLKARRTITAPKMKASKPRNS